MISTMKAIEIRNFFVDNSDFIDQINTVDRIIIGNPNKEIKSVLCTLYSDFDAIKYAVKNKFDMVITHEPTFWVHANELDVINSWDKDTIKSKNAMLKKKYIDESGLVILRIHDVWDKIPKIGMLASWIKFLGFEKLPCNIIEHGLRCTLKIKPIKLDDLAKLVALSTAKIGEPYAHVFGDGNKLISNIGLTIGCGATLWDFTEIGCDVSIVADDGTTYWSDIKYSKDINHSVIYVNHGTSEEPGMASMAKYLEESLPELKVEHLPNKCGLRIVNA